MKFEHKKPGKKRKIIWIVLIILILGVALLGVVLSLAMRKVSKNGENHMQVIPFSKEEKQCTCRDKTCSETSINSSCPVCCEDFHQCTYVEPVVEIQISDLLGWQNAAARVEIEVLDIANSGNLHIQSVEAKTNENPYVDITDSMEMILSEDGTLSIKVIEENGRETLKEKKYECFDWDKPSILARSEGEILYVTATDLTSGIATVYVEGTPFKDLSAGNELAINLKDYEAEYPYLTLQSVDHAGNKSDLYQVKNPFYVSEEDMGQTDQSTENPLSTERTEPASSKATVIEYTDEEGVTVEAENVEELMPGDSLPEEQEKEMDIPGEGKEFFTIQTEGGRTFYLIVDRDRNSENVYLLSEVDELELLNFVNHEGEEVLQGDIPLYTITGQAMEKQETQTDEQANFKDILTRNTETDTDQTEAQKTPVKNNQSTTLIVGIAGGCIVAYLLKKKKKKKKEQDDESESEEQDGLNGMRDNLFLEEETEDKLAEETEKDFDTEELFMTSDFDYTIYQEPK